MGLTGQVQQAEWDALCDNRHPDSGEPLTRRCKAERRVGYDFNFHVPKSVSLVYGLTHDERILEAFRESVGETMRDVEAETKARVRKGGRNEDRTTGNMVWGEFMHFTARPVGGIPDPHLHAHCFVFNTTWDEEEQSWKAGQFGDIKRDSPYFEAKFHSRLAKRLSEMGFEIERTRTGWELAGVDKSATDKFSRRTAMIEDEARKRGVSDPAAKSELGVKTREHKRKDLSLDQLADEWRTRLSDQEVRSIKAVVDGLGARRWGEDPGAAKQALALSTDHVFERKSVTSERELLARALKHSVGKATVDSVEAALARSDLVRADKSGCRMVTTPNVLAEEKRMIAFARQGRGTRQHLGRKGRCINRDWLNADQKKAVEHVLGSRDGVILVRGAAGVGKTIMMREAVEGIEENGMRVFTLAPSAGARDVLKKEGFERAETVARLLVDSKLQAETKGQVLWVDEAGLIGSKTMTRLFDLAKQMDCRVVLSGDRRQHGSVERGAALRLLENEAGLQPSEIREIQRQAGYYRQALQALADGRTEEGFAELVRLGWVREVDSTERYKAMAADYVQSARDGVETLVVSPTHAEGERITRAIREGLREEKLLGGDERSFPSLSNVNLTQAERGDAVNYVPGDVLVFHQNARGFAKGQRLIAGRDAIPFDQAARFQVFHPSEFRLAPDDMLRVTRNGKTLDGRHRLNNGDLYRVGGFDDSGNIVLENGWKVSRDYGHLAHGYCVTSHTSQGKSVPRVLIGQSSDSFPASSREQFYVSVSRGRKQVTVFTDDKQGLLKAIKRSDDRLSATELVSGGCREKGAAIQRRNLIATAYPADGRRENREMIHER